MAKKPNQYIELSGPLFDDRMVEKFLKAVHEGMEDLGDDGASILAAAVSQGGFRKSGSFIQSIESKGKDASGSSAGYVAVKPTGQWPVHGRPTMTWMETGKRGGTRLRKGTYAFRKAATAMKAQDFDQYFADRIREAIS